jgi:uncharacterized membrane protein
VHIFDLFILFAAYSFIGWAWESALFTVQERKFVNRGFLNGPLCPIYGFGGLLLVWALEGRTNNLLVLFVAAIVLTTALECLTAILLEKLFNDKWWDYSMFPLNLKGRISLISSLVFGVMSVLLIKYMHPFARDMTGRLAPLAKHIFVAVLAVYLLVDISLTVRHELILSGRLGELRGAASGFFDKKLKGRLLRNRDGGDE